MKLDGAVKINHEHTALKLSCCFCCVSRAMKEAIKPLLTPRYDCRAAAWTSRRGKGGEDRAQQGYKGEPQLPEGVKTLKFLVYYTVCGLEDICSC